MRAFRQIWKPLHSGWPSFLALSAFLLSSGLEGPQASEPNWAEGAPVPAGGRPNPYGWEPAELRARAREGRIHALWYPVGITASLLPERPLRNLLEDPFLTNPLGRLVRDLFGDWGEIRNLDDAQAWLGMHPYPPTEGLGAYEIPFPTGGRPDFRMGYTRILRKGVTGLTASCAECHAGDLFGQRVLGLTNRFPRANEAFLRGQQLAPLVSATLFQSSTGATDAETEMFAQAKDRLKFTESKRPLMLGLDTSLAHVALALSRRAADDVATLDPHAATFPRHDRLRFEPADSKPAVWWNVKYKNRWLSDGSVVSGNPIATNILWNEIGRGTDLRTLADWFTTHPSVIESLTTAVFAAEAPRFTDFFPAESIGLERARRGEETFKQLCARCHGNYEKAWSKPGSEAWPLARQLETTRVLYPAQTPVIDVGTDPYRYEGMASLERALNPLALSRRQGVWIRAQKGYVPPPLEGIWARWPYFHHGVAPSLCAVLSRAEDRPRQYQAGPAVDRDRDFDRECNGYPIGERVPAEWREHPEWVYESGARGLSRRGHDEGIVLLAGRERLTSVEKRELIAFLQTL